MKKTVNRITSLVLAAFIVCTCALSASAACYIQWGSNPGLESLVDVKSSSDFTLYENSGKQTVLFPMTEGAPDIGIQDNKITFNIQITDTSNNSDWGAIFCARISQPANGPWGPGNNSVYVRFRKDQISLGRYSNGVADESSEKSISAPVFDGKIHSVSLEFQDKNVTLEYDDQSVTATFKIYPKMGGYQWMAMNATVAVTNFDNYAAAPQPPQPDVTVPQETENQTEATNPAKPTQPAVIPSKPAETETDSTQDNTESAVPSTTQAAQSDSESSTPMVVAIIGVVLVAAAGVIYFVVTKKKK